MKLQLNRDNRGLLMIIIARSIYQDIRNMIFKIDNDMLNPFHPHLRDIQTRVEGFYMCNNLVVCTR